VDINKDFIGSFAFDVRLAQYDIAGSLAHVKMLAKQKILSQVDCAKINKGLTAISLDIQKGWKLPAEEDIHYAIEKELIKRIGPVGGKCTQPAAATTRLPLTCAFTFTTRSKQ
jgi:argininosuccinate lyase